MADKSLQAHSIIWDGIQEVFGSGQLCASQIAEVKTIVMIHAVISFLQYDIEDTL